MGHVHSLSRLWYHAKATCKILMLWLAFTYYQTSKGSDIQSMGEQDNLFMASFHDFDAKSAKFALKKMVFL